MALSSSEGLRMRSGAGKDRGDEKQGFRGIHLSCLGISSVSSSVEARDKIMTIAKHFQPAQFCCLSAPPTLAGRAKGRSGLNRGFRGIHTSRPIQPRLRFKVRSKTIRQLVSCKISLCASFRKIHGRTPARVV